jgi:hypothetical protein
MLPRAVDGARRRAPARTVDRDGCSVETVTAPAFEARPRGSAVEVQNDDPAAVRLVLFLVRHGTLSGMLNVERKLEPRLLVLAPPRFFFFTKPNLLDDERG